MPSWREIIYQALEHIIFGDLIHIVIGYAESTRHDQLAYILEAHRRPNGSGELLFGDQKSPDISVRWNFDTHDYENKKYMLTIWVGRYENIHGLEFEDLLPDKFGDKWPQFGHQYKLRELYAEKMHLMMARY